MRVLLVSTYDLGRQPFGLASPAAWLKREGAEVECLDLAVQLLDPAAVRRAELIAFYLPMHTATRLAVRVARRVREINPDARLCFYGLYAAMNEPYLRSLGAEAVLGGEFEEGLAGLVRRRGEANGEPATLPGGRAAAEAAGPPIGSNGHGAGSEPLVSLERLQFIPPDRTGLPPLSSYARLITSEGPSRSVGYTEASRGCKHRCRHCPVVPVYDGRFRIVQREVVLEDVRRQVAAGAEHISFGDPDFFNGIGHAIPLVRALHAEHPALGYDVTIKIEHLLRHGEHLATLRDTGCRFVTSAVESIDDAVLARLDKGHTCADFIEVVQRFREAGLTLNPTFVAFHPWLSLEGYRELLAALANLDLVDHVAPIQLAIRLLIPAGSKLLELDEVRRLVGPFDAEALYHPWRHPDPRVDRLHAEVEALVRQASARGETRAEIFARAWRLAGAYANARVRALERAKGRASTRLGPRALSMRRAALAAKRPPVPFLTEPWYC